MATNPSWTPNLNVAAGYVIIDPNGNVQVCTIAGVTALQPPDFADLNIGETTPDGSQVQWTLKAILTPSALPAFPLPALPPPTFVNDADGLDPTLVLNDQVATYESITGRTLYPAQVERLYINGAAYRETLVRQAVQEAGMQNLVAFASFPQLDYLGQLVGVSRLPSQPALTTIQFTLVNALSVAFVLAAGTQIGTADGQFQFVTTTALSIPAGATIGSVGAQCVEGGAEANGYLVGSVNVLLNPDALVASVTNLATTSGGSDPETDDHLRARIQLAPNQFTCAGPSDEYRAIALGVDPSIIDVLVPEVPATPGTVDVWVLVGPISQPAASGTQGVASGPLLAKVAAALNAATVRPLCDTVAVHAVTEVNFEISAIVVLYADADPTTVQAAANQGAVLFATNLATRIQRDFVTSELIAALSVPGVYQVQVTYNLTHLNPGQWANVVSIDLTFQTSTESS